MIIFWNYSIKWTVFPAFWQVRGEGVQRCTLGGSAEFTIQV